MSSTGAGDFDVRKTLLLHNSCGGCVVSFVWVLGFVMAVLWLLGSTGLQWARLLWR